jgi:hypothetical protein
MIVCGMVQSFLLYLGNLILRMRLSCRIRLRNIKKVPSEARKRQKPTAGKAERRYDGEK